MGSNVMMIGGSGRSGTTILCRTVARHPDVTDVPEWRFTTDPDGIVDFYTQTMHGLQSPFHFDVRVKRLATLLRRIARRRPVGSLLGSARLRRLALRIGGHNIAPAYARTSAVDYSPNFEALASQLIDRLTSSTYDGYWVGMRPMERARVSFSQSSTDQVREACREFLEGVARDVCAYQGAQRHLEKNTWNILCWHRTLEILPDAKLVHIVRDPRDVVSSFREQPWVPSSAVESARVLATIMDEWGRIKKLVPSDSFREIRLEDLTRDPEGVLRELCEFWEVDWSPVMLESRLSGSSFGRWRHDLTATEQAAIEPFVAPLLTKYGYE